MNTIFLLGMPGGAEWVVLLAVMLLLFGGSRLPQLAKGIGQSMKEFKKGMADGESNDDANEIAGREPRLLKAESRRVREDEVAFERGAVSKLR